MDNLENDLVQEKKVHKKTFLLKSLLLFVILILLGVLFYVFKDKITGFLPIILKNTKTNIVSQTEPSPDSPFGDILDKQKTEVVGETDFTKLDVGFKEEIVSLVSRTGQLVNWGEDWNWKTSWVFGKIISLENNKVKISFVKPDSMQGQVKEFEPFCDKEKTIILSKENLVILDADVDIDNAIQPGYLIYTHCLDEECLQLGNGCVVVKMF